MYGRFRHPHDEPVAEDATQSRGVIREALAYPKSGDDWLKTVGIGGTLMFFGFLIIPFVFVLGYFVRVFRSGAYSEHVQPRFDDWTRLFVDGVKLLSILVVYGFVGNIPLFALDAGIEPGVGILGTIWLAVTFAVMFFVTYISPAVVTNFSVEESVVAAFHLRTIVAGAFTTDYLTAVVSGMVIYLLLGLIAMVLSFVLVGIFVFFYMLVAIFYLFGRGSGRAMNIDTKSTMATD